jgi:glycosyltransferase involved in cell wall biosynthesis
MDVSVIVPTRNRSALLATTLRSALCQQDIDLEVIVVDEASTDDTLEVIASFRDSRIRVIRHNTPRGVSAARNHGAEHAVGDWLAFLDDDDLWAPDKLVRQKQAAEAAGRDWVYAGSVNITGDCRVVFGQPPLPAEEMVEALLRWDAIPGGGSNVAVRRKAWQRAGPFDPRLRAGEDWEMWLRLAKHGPPACVCKPLMARRLHGSNATLDIAETVRGIRLIETLHHTRTDWGRLHLWMAQSSLRNGRRSAALRQYMLAATHGKARFVASDLRRMVIRRVRRLLRIEESSPTSAWIEAAAAWLQELRDTKWPPHDGYACRGSSRGTPAITL